MELNDTVYDIIKEQEKQDEKQDKTNNLLKSQNSKILVALETIREDYKILFDYINNQEKIFTERLNELNQKINNTEDINIKIQEQMNKGFFQKFFEIFKGK